MAEDLKQSWMYWEYKSFGKTWGSSGQRTSKTSMSLNTILQSEYD
jgi:hypothetical protein